jgi:hypothetical protein
LLWLTVQVRVIQDVGGDRWGDMNVNPLSPQKKTKEKSLCIKKNLGVSRAFFFCTNNWQILTRRNRQGVNAFMGEKQIPRLLICNVWSPCVLSLFLMVWHLPITKNKQGNNENTLDIPGYICYNIFNSRFPIWKENSGSVGNCTAQ